MKVYNLTDEMIKNIIEVSFGMGKVCGVSGMKEPKISSILSDLKRNQLELHKEFSNEK